MKKIFTLIFILFVLYIPVLSIAAEKVDENYNLSVALMRSTFLIYGDSGINGRVNLGTAFILGKPSQKNKTISYYVLITAAHVLNDIKGEKAKLCLRRKKNNSYEKYDYEITIRNGEKPIWKSLPNCDVAVMYVALPEDTDIELVSTDMLASDDTLKNLDIHPGDELFALGYPLGFYNDFGFSVLRSGKIASYPLLPTKDTKTFLLDFKVFGGNSGGPVFFSQSNRTIKNSFTLRYYNEILGLVSQQQTYTESVDTLYEKGTRTTYTDLAIIVHASFIRETITLLPEPE